MYEVCRVWQRVLGEEFTGGLVLAFRTMKVAEPASDNDGSAIINTNTDVVAKSMLYRAIAFQRP